MILGHTVPVSLMTSKCVAFLEIENTFAWFSEKLRRKRCILKLQEMRKFGSILNTKNAIQACLLHRLFFSYILWSLFKRVVLGVYLLWCTNFQYSFWARTQSLRKFFSSFELLRKQPSEGLSCSLVSWHLMEVLRLPFPNQVMQTLSPWPLWTLSLEVSCTYHAFKLRQLFFQFQDTKSVLLLLLSLLFRIRRCIDCHDHQAHGICGETLEFAFYH